MDDTATDTTDTTDSADQADTADETLLQDTTPDEEDKALSTEDDSDEGETPPATNATPVAATSTQPTAQPVPQSQAPLPGTNSPPKQGVPYSSVNNLALDAQAILNTAPSLSDGMNALSQSYNQYNWDKPALARQTLQKYSDQMRYRFQDQSVYSPAEVGAYAPIGYDQVIKDGAKTPADKINQINDWEKQNLDIVTTDNDTATILGQSKLTKSISNVASQMRQQVNTFGESNYGDLGYRALEGGTANPARAVQGLTDLFGGSFKASNYVSWLKEHEKDAEGSDLSSYVARVVKSAAGIGGFAGTAAGASLVGTPYAGAAYLGASGIGATLDEYDKALEATGDHSKADKAAAIQGVNQVLQTLVGGKLFAGIGQAAEAAGTSLAQKLVGNVVQHAGSLGSVSLVGQVLSNLAGAVGSGQEVTEQKLEEGTLEAAGAGVLVGGVTGGLKGVRSTGADTGTHTFPDIIVPDDSTPRVTGEIHAAPLDKETTADTEAKGALKPTIKTVDGNAYVPTEEGSTKRVSPTGNVYHPLDKTVYVDEKTAMGLAAQKLITGDKETRAEAGGKYLTTNGEDLFHVTTDEKGNIVERGKPVKYSNEPAPDLYPVEVNTPRAPNDNTTLFRSRIGTKIVEVAPKVEIPPEDLSQLADLNIPRVGVQDQSLGAAYAGQMKETTTGERLRNATTLNNEVTGLFKTVPYITIEASDESQRGRVANTGLVKSTDFYFNDKEFDDSYKINLGKVLLEKYDTAIQENKGNAPLVEQLQNTAKSIGIDLADKLSKSAQTLRIGRELSDALDPITKVRDQQKRLADSAVQEVAKEEGIKPEDIQGIDQKIQSITDALNNEQKLAEAQAKAAGKTTPEGQTPEPITSPKAEVLKDELKKAQTLKKKTDTRVAKKLEQFPEKDQKTLGSLYKEKAKTEDSSIKAKLQDAVDAMTSKLDKDPAEKAQKNYVKQITKKVLSGNTLLQYFVSNVLTPLSLSKKIYTDVKSLVGTPIALLASGKPRQALEFTKGAGKALFEYNPKTKSVDSQAVQSFLNTLLTGNTSHFKGNDFLSSAPLLLKPIGFVSRALSAVTEGFGAAQKEGYLRALTHEFYSKEGKASGIDNPKDLRTYVSERMFKDFNPSVEMGKALESAKTTSDKLQELTGKGLTKREQKLTAWRSLQDKSPEYAKTEAEYLSKKAVFINHPTGIAGFVYDALAGFKDIPVGFNKEGQGALTIRPFSQPLAFLRVMLNLINFKSDLAGAGIVRSFFPYEQLGFSKGVKGDVANYRMKSDTQRAVEFGRGAVGAFMTYTVLQAALSNKDKQVPDFMVHGRGSNNWQNVSQSIDEGRLPYSIQVGTSYKSFKNTLLEYPLTIVGDIMDQIRNKQGEDTTLNEKIFTGAASMIDAVVNEAGFKSISDVWSGVKNIGSDNAYAGQKIFDGLVVNTAKSFIPWKGLTSGFSTDPIDSKTSTWARLISGTPVIQQLGGTKPALNYLGEHVSVEPNVSKAITYYGFNSSDETKVDPTLRWVADNGYSLPKDRNVTIHLLNKNQLDSHPRTVEERTSELGAQYKGILTPNERYDLIANAGPKIKQVLQSYMNQYGSSGYQESVQKQLAKDISKVFNDTKREMFMKD